MTALETENWTKSLKLVATKTFLHIVLKFYGCSERSESEGLICACTTSSAVRT